MNRLPPDVSKRLVKTTDAQNTDFIPATFMAISTLINSYLTDDDLKPINEALAKRKLRRIGLDDIHRVAYIHTRSIRENDGYSPYKRIIIYSAKNGYKYNTWHIKVITEILIGIGFLTMLSDASRDAQKRQWKENICRKYSLTLALKFERPSTSTKN